MCRGGYHTDLVRTIRTAARRALPAILLPALLAACGPVSTLASPSTASSPTSDSQATAVSPTGMATTTPPVAVPPAPAPSGVHVVHSPGAVTDDEHLATGQCHARTAADGQPLPDPACTPGAVDPAVTQANVASTICRSGYTATIRPPASDTGRWKIRTYLYYDLSTTTSGEYDHLVPLELGGANATSNLWIQPGAIPNPKDKVENRLHDKVCAGQLTLAAAQQAIAADWTTAP
jgi:hypothetical protein